MGRYADEFRRSLDDPEGYWRDAAGAIDWITPPTRILDDSAPPMYRWFPDAELNTCYNALDRHVERGRAEQVALIYDSPVTDQVVRYTYRELRDQVAKVAGALRDARRGEGRPGRRLHADGARGRDRDAGLRPARRGALGRLRRVRGGRAGHPDQRRPAAR